MDWSIDQPIDSSFVDCTFQPIDRPAVHRSTLKGKKEGRGRSTKRPIDALD